MLRKLLTKDGNFNVENVKTVHDFTLQFLHMIIADLAGYLRHEYCKFC